MLDVARGAEEALRLVQGVGVDAAGQDLARRRHGLVVGAGQTGDRVQQYHDVPLVLDQAARLLDHHLRDLHVPRGLFVERGGNHLSPDVALHVGDLFGTLVDQQHDQKDLGVILRNGIRDPLQQHGLAGARRRHDQPALPLAEGAEQVHHPRFQVAIGGFQVELLVGIQRREVIERHPVLRDDRRVVVDRLHEQHREEPLSVLGGADLAVDRVSGLEVESPDLRRRHVYVLGPREIAVVGRSQKAVSIREDLQHAVGVDHATLGMRVFLEDAEDEIRLLHPHEAFGAQPHGSRLAAQLRKVLDGDIADQELLARGSVVDRRAQSVDAVAARRLRLLLSRLLGLRDGGLLGQGAVDPVEAVLDFDPELLSRS